MRGRKREQERWWGEQESLDSQRENGRAIEEIAGETESERKMAKQRQPCRDYCLIKKLPW